MLRRLRHRLTYANVMSSMAFFLALTGGTAFAVTAIDSNSVFSEDIVNGEVKNADLGGNSIGSGKVANDSLTGSDVSALTGGDVTNDSLTGADLAAGAVGTPQLQDLGVTGAKLADLGVTTDKLGARAVTRPKLGIGSVGQVELASDSVGAGEMRTNSVASTEIFDGSVGALDINSNAVGAQELITDSVGSTDLAPASVGADEHAVLPGARVTAGAQSILNDEITNINCQEVDGFSETGSGGFDNGNMFRPGVGTADDGELVVQKAGVYAINGQINWAEDLGEYTTTLSAGSAKASERTRDGDRGSVSTIARVTGNTSFTLTGCWDGFGDSRAVGSGSYLSAQWLGP